MNVAEVTTLAPVPTVALPTGTPAGTYVSSVDAERLAVVGTVAAVQAALEAASGGLIVFAQLTALDGTLVSVNSWRAADLQPLPPEVLPSAIPDGTRVLLEDGLSLNIAGTPAAVAAALLASQTFSFVVAARAAFFWDGLNVVLQSSFNVASVLRAGIGVFTLTTFNPIAAGPSIVTGSNQGPGALVSPLVIDCQQTSPTTYAITTFDVGGVAQDPDVGISVVIFPAVPV